MNNERINSFPDDISKIFKESVSKWNLRINDQALENQFILQQYEQSRQNGKICGRVLFTFCVVISIIAIIEDRDKMNGVFIIFNLLPAIIFLLISIIHHLRFSYFNFLFPILMMAHISVFFLSAYLSSEIAPVPFIPSCIQFLNSSQPSSFPNSTSTISISTVTVMLLMGSGTFQQRVGLNALYASSVVLIEISFESSQKWSRSILSGLLLAGFILTLFITQERQRKMRFLEEIKSHFMDDILQRTLPVSILTTKFDSSKSRLVFGMANENAQKSLHITSDSKFQDFLEECYVDQLDQGSSFLQANEFESAMKRIGISGALSLKQICKEVLILRQQQSNQEQQQLTFLQIKSHYSAQIYLKKLKKKLKSLVSYFTNFCQKKNEKQQIQISSITEINQNLKINLNYISNANQNGMNSPRQVFKQALNKRPSITQSHFSHLSQQWANFQELNSPKHLNSLVPHILKQGNSSNFSNLTPKLNQGTPQSKLAPNQSFAGMISQTKNPCTLLSGWIREEGGVNRRINIRIWTQNLIQEYVSICIEDVTFKQQNVFLKNKCYQLQLILSQLMERQEKLLKKLESNIQLGILNLNCDQITQAFGSQFPLIPTALKGTLLKKQKLHKSKTLDIFQNNLKQLNNTGLNSKFNNNRYQNFLPLPQNSLNKQSQDIPNSKLSGKNIPYLSIPAPQLISLPLPEILEKKNNQINSLPPKSDKGERSKANTGNHHLYCHSFSSGNSLQQKSQPITFGNTNSPTTIIDNLTTNSNNYLPKEENQQKEFTLKEEINKGSNQIFRQGAKENLQIHHTLRISPKKFSTGWAKSERKYEMEGSITNKNEQSIASPSQGEINTPLTCVNNSILQNTNKLTINEEASNNEIGVGEEQMKKQHLETDSQKQDENLICNFDVNYKESEPSNEDQGIPLESSQNNQIPSHKLKKSASNETDQNLDFQTIYSYQQGQSIMKLNKFSNILTEDSQFPSEANEEETNDTNQQLKHQKLNVLNLQKAIQLIQNFQYLTTILYSPKNFKSSFCLVNLIQITKKILSTFSSLAEKKKLIIKLDNKTIENETYLTSLFTDKQKIYSLLFNLIQNAISYSKSDSTINISFFNHSNLQQGSLNPPLDEIQLPSNECSFQDRIQKENCSTSPHSKILVQRKQVKVSFDSGQQQSSKQFNELKVIITNELTQKDEHKILSILQQYLDATPETFLSTQTSNQFNNCNEEIKNKLLKKQSEDSVGQFNSSHKLKITNSPKERFVYQSLNSSTFSQLNSNNTKLVNLGIFISKNILRQIGPYEKIIYTQPSPNILQTEFLLYSDLRQLEPEINIRAQRSSFATPLPIEHKSKFCNSSFYNDNLINLQSNQNSENNFLSNNNDLSDKKKPNFKINEDVSQDILLTKIFLTKKIKLEEIHSNEQGNQDWYSHSPSDNFSRQSIPIERSQCNGNANINQSLQIQNNFSY